MYHHEFEEAGNLASDALELSTMAIASATVPRKASAPRRSTIPAIMNVFRGCGPRCVINSPTPRFCKNGFKMQCYKMSAHEAKKCLPGIPPEVRKIFGQPYKWIATCMRQHALGGEGGDECLRSIAAVHIGHMEDENRSLLSTRCFRRM